MDRRSRAGCAALRDLRTMPFSPEIQTLAETLINEARSADVKIATAESCTGGLISGALTAISGSSDVFDRGFVTYSNESKQQMLDVSPSSIDKFGAVSADVAKEMAYGALTNSQADIAVSVTGVAGPGCSEGKPVGLVWFAVAVMGRAPEAFSKSFENSNRSEVRLKTVRCALTALRRAL